VFVVTVFRCPICRTRRKDQSLLLQHLEQSGHEKDQLCRCSAYKYPHRAGSALCAVQAEIDATLQRHKISVTPAAPSAKKRGRPSKPDAITPAQRAKAYRARKKTGKA
jgi:hypothetical protein